MEVHDISVKKLTPYEKNPRYNDKSVDAVAESIEEFGFLVPVVIDKDNTIVAGHTRYKAAQKLGLDSIPCVVAEQLTPAQIKAFRIIDNKTNELSMWNFDYLQIEMKELQDWDFSEFGFDTEELNFFKGSVFEPEEEPEAPKFQMFHSNKLPETKVGESIVHVEDEEYKNETAPSNRSWFESGIDYAEKMMNTRRIVIEYTEEDVPFLQELLKTQSLKSLMKASDLKKAVEA